MIEAPIPANEPDRLAALQELRILDTPAEERFDRLTRIARDLFQVPIALVSLVDAKRQWFKSKIGLDASETPRAISFCGHAILGNDPFVVENAVEDSRFADNPLVTAPPGIRFYAGMPLRSVTGTKLGTLCIIDRTPRRFSADDARRLRDLAAWAERELNLSVAIEAAIAEMRDTFVRLVSHELRTPITSVIGALELIRSGMATGDNVTTLANMAADGTGKLNRIVDEIIEIAELDAGRQDLTFSDVDLPLFIQAAMESYVDRGRQVEVSLRVDVPESLSIRTAPKSLVRILRALLDNALHFAPTGSLITIAATHAQSDRVRISVTDQGPGIPPQHIPRLFQPFAQADATDSRTHEGCGISLSICHRLANAMGAHLGYEPVAGGGSRFFLDLPVAAP